MVRDGGRELEMGILKDREAGNKHNAVEPIEVGDRGGREGRMRNP